MRNRTILLVLGLSFLLSFSPLSADSRIQRGIDVFVTAGDGKTFYDFSYSPIPADFFCKGSTAFTGQVAFKGLPLKTETPGQLWGADTVVERLDDAVFGNDGSAVTRLQFRALSLVSIAPVKTVCGDFHVYVSLDGTQRVTTMSIFRTQEGGGSFVAPLAVDARMTFIPVKLARNQVARKLVLPASITFPANSLPWSLAADFAAKRTGPVVVDTDGDLLPDALLPSTSNFSPGQSPGNFESAGPCSCCPEELCHADSGQYHCIFVPMCPGTQSCC